MSLGEVSCTLDEFLSVCCIFGWPDKSPTKCEQVMDVQFLESYASMSSINPCDNICLSCRGSRRPWVLTLGPRHLIKVSFN